MPPPTSADSAACALVARALGIQGAVAISDNMASLPAWDSLTHVQLILELETALGRTLTPIEVGGIGSVRDVAALLEARG
jgi:acyl carrier protein